MNMEILSEFWDLILNILKGFFFWFRFVRITVFIVTVELKNLGIK